MSVIAPENLLPTDPAAPPAAGPGGHSEAWVWKVSGLCLLLGLLLALSLRTNQQIEARKLPSIRHGAPVAALSKYEEKKSRLVQEVEQLRDQVNDFRANRQDDSRTRTLLKEQLRDYRAMVGFAPVQGPGLRIRLQDSVPTSNLPPGTKPSELWVMDRDVNGIISELRAAGAEAFCISEAGGKNAQRLILTSTARTVGRAILVNGATLKPPYEITAIGNPKELQAALEMPEGIIDNRGLKILKMITIEESRHLVLPAYTSENVQPAPES